MASMTQNISTLIKIYRNQIAPHVGNTHLDFGCASGQGTRGISAFKQETKVVGYEPIKSKIKQRGLFIYFNRVAFISTLPDPAEAKFDSASASFVYHEDPNIISQIYPYLSYGGKLCILDYNIKGKNLDTFQKTFDSQNEIRAIEKEGLIRCFEKHTALGLEDCEKSFREAGLKIIDKYISDTHYVLVGRK